ncbi:hypothetical protein GDO86_009958 [Hymenochirus boettgeri]|uniref:Uncharacterized protein n=1 Tax=Hymenochirus boettgeri TaxID=247094 RepID=A0A8T2JNU7_9PIPI|nr:hypothetical protein GDO86_009958 [Hymenochirus boettgeri]
MARDCTESRFTKLLDRFGGPQSVLIIGELWDRAESREFLGSFLRTVFPNCTGPPRESLPDCGGKKDFDFVQSQLSTGPDEPPSKCKGHRDQDRQVTPCKSSDLVSDRTLLFPLVFFLCRAESLRLRKSRLQLQEILRDLRGRTGWGTAVIGVLVPVSGAGKRVEESESDGHSPDCLVEDVASLLALLHSVFPPGTRGSRWCEVRAAALVPGQDETREHVQLVSCEALLAADVYRHQKPQTLFLCLPWRKSRVKNNSVKKEGAALTVIKYHNGDCAESTTDS